MTRKNPYFGRALSIDPALLEAPDTLGRFALRRRGERFLVLLTPDSRQLTITDASSGRGPDRLVTEAIPHPTVELPVDDWELQAGKLVVPYLTQVPLADAERVPSLVMPPVRDFPGHMRIAVNRALRPVETELKERMGAVARALKTPLAEAVEEPILRVVGFGPGSVPAGDRALAGLLLTGRAFFVGRRLRAKWLGRLGMEVRRFLHRTTVYARAMVGYALEGRTTGHEEEFFLAMQKDFEGAVELAVEKIREDDPMGGAGFLLGVQAALDLIHGDMYPAFQKREAARALPGRGRPRGDDGEEI